MHAPAVRNPLPAARDDPLDAVLDLIEANIELALGLGLEAQIRARFARLLPAPSVAHMATGASSPEGAALSTLGACCIHGAGALSAPEAPSKNPLDLAAILTACRDVEQLKLRAGQHAAIARLKAWLVAEMQSPRAGCASGQPKAQPK